MSDQDRHDERARPDAATIAFEQSPDLILVTEGEDHLLVGSNLSAAALPGPTPTPGRPLQETVGGSAASVGLIRLFDDTIEGGHAFTWETRRVDVGGTAETPRLFDVSACRWSDRDAGRAGVVARAVPVGSHGRRGQPQEIRRERRPHHLAGDADLRTAVHDEVLPDELPLVPGVDVAAGYVFAGAEIPVRGDWFDAVPRADGTVALVIGDVVGRGVSASVTACRLRAASAASLLEGAPPGDVLERIDRFASTSPTAIGARMAVVVVDPRDGRLEYATAGHPDPVVVTSEAQVRPLTEARSPVLGRSRAHTTATDALAPGDVLILCTDGILDRQHVGPARSVEELAQLLAPHVSGRAPDDRARLVDRVARLGLETFGRGSVPVDDLALLVAARAPHPPGLDIGVGEAAETPVHARTALARWLESFQVRAVDQIAVLHAVHELVVNALEHAYPSGDGTVRVTAEVAPDGTLTCRVADHGRWAARAGDGGGRGLAMASGLVDELVIDRTADGTTATVRHRLTRPAHLFLAATDDRRGENADMPFTAAIEDRRIRLVGAVDESAADELGVILRAHAGNADPVTIDLTAVDLLGSAALRLIDDALVTGPELRVVAPAGSVAEQVLDASGLPWRRPDSV
ncbi:histidine kinase-like protein [Mumia flava]|uniref:Histidine kinase-like protein n=1 Tax=Mumia flava TaxID=1348852 RepID=A0A2M9BDV7_9ACTN|nr:SpoIIE family protein phosphatase [Mumia flava]PJJ56141.1 histidine kinase-like protein [Mumia flava]